MNLVSGDQDKVSDDEIVNFMMMASHNHLDPFLKEVFLVKFGSKPAQIIVSKEAFMKRADRNENYDGFKAGVIVERDNEVVDEEGAFLRNSDKLIGGWATVYRKDREHPVTSRITLREFSKGQSTWNQMPANMIRKTAIVNALREAFPRDLGAMYTEDDVPPREVVGEETPQEVENVMNVVNEARQEEKQENPVENNQNVSESQPEQTSAFENINDIIQDDEIEDDF